MGFSDSGLLHFWTLSVRYKLSPGEGLETSSAIRLLGLDNRLAGFLYHVDDDRHRNQPLPATGEVLILSGSDLTPLMDKSARHMRIVPEQRAPPSEWHNQQNAYNIMMITQDSCGISSRFALGLIAKAALRQALEPGPEWKEIILG